MKRKMTNLMSMIAAVSLIWIGAVGAHAEDVDGTWENPTGQGNGPITDANTNDPIVGDPVDIPPDETGANSSNAADGEMIHSPFTPITLAAEGDKLTFTGMVTLQGTINSPSSAGNPRTQFRFGVFDGDEVGDDLGWVGYFMHNKHGDAGTPAGVLAEKPTGNTSIYLSTTGQTTITSVQGDGTPASLFNDDTYDLSLTIERDGAGALIVTGVIDAQNLEFTQTLTGTDATPPSYTFDYLGFLTGNNLDADRAAYADLVVTFTPGTIAEDADFDDDEDVDGEDFLIWQRGLGGAGGTDNADGNADGDSDVDGDDLTIWGAQFGAATVNAQSIPEPSSLALGGLALATMASIARRRHAKCAS